MKCPYCGSFQTSVLESRPCTDETGIRRRRDCQDCNRRFTTYERVSNPLITVVKKDGRREAFDRDKLSRKLCEAFHKRPISVDQLEQVVDGVERQLLKQATPEVPSSLVGQVVLQEIKVVDKVAWLRFASVYLAFDSLEDFEAAIEEQLSSK